jgi:ABC-type nitrate/sulfonate/bicarbonate transport system permease component
MARWKILLTNLAGVALVVAVWQLVVNAQLVSNVLLPAPNMVLRRLAELSHQPEFWTDLISTLTLWFLSVLCGAAVGLLVGLASYVERGIWHFIEIPVEFIRSLPSVVLVPLVALFAGLGGGTQFVSAFLVVAALMIASSAAVVRNLPIGQDRLVHAWRVTRVSAIHNFVLPNLLAEMFVALRAAVPLALVVVIACDMLVATEAGLGKLIRDGLAILDMQTTFAAILAVGLLGYSGSLVVSLCDRILIIWRRA